MGNQPRGVSTSECEGGCKPRDHRSELEAAVLEDGGFVINAPKADMDAWKSEVANLGKVAGRKVHFYWSDLISGLITVGATINLGAEPGMGVCPGRLLYHTMPACEASPCQAAVKNCSRLRNNC